MHRANLLGRGYDDPHLDPPRVRFRRALSLAVMSTFVPGSAQVALGRPWARRLVLALWLGVAVALGLAAYLYATNREGFIAWFADRDHLFWVQIAVVIAAAGWALLLLDAWRLGTHGKLRWPQTATVVVVNLALIGTVGLGSAWAVTTLEAPREAVQRVFTSTVVSEPLEGRYNVLLIGSDSDPARRGVRTDSMTVVSIDAATGNTALVSLPRNLQNVPFAEGSPMAQVYPNGFSCGSECLLNAVHTYASARPDLYPDSDDPGLEATIDAVEGATGLELNYYIMVNMTGFRRLVNAVGGLELNVKDRVPIGGGSYPIIDWIEPGVQKLDGRRTLWFARSRATSDDYARMGRQKCVMLAMAQQLSPQTVLLNAQEIGAASADMLSTNIPEDELSKFVEMALKARNGRIVSVSFVPPEINPAAPDYEKIHQMVQTAIATSEGTATPSPSATEEPDQSDTLRGASSRARASNFSDDLTKSC